MALVNIALAALLLLVAELLLTDLSPDAPLCPVVRNTHTKRPGAPAQPIPAAQHFHAPIKKLT